MESAAPREVGAQPPSGGQPGALIAPMRQIAIPGD